MVALLVSAGFAGWSWFRPYAWSVDSAARCKVIGAQVKQDHSYFWVDLHLKLTPGQTHDASKPVLLRTSAGRELNPADILLGGGLDGGATELWLKFWLEPGDMDGPLSLQINDGALVIKADSGVPSMGGSHSRYFVTQHW